MKKALCALAILATSLPALAESVDVRVIGTITPTACKPTIGGGGTIDYGVIDPSTLSATAYTVLPEKQVPISVFCEAPAKMALQVKNMRMGSLAGATEGATGAGTLPVTIFGVKSVYGVGLGLDGDDKIGGYGIRLVPSTVKADEKVVDVIYRNAGTTAWLKTPLGSLYDSAVQCSTSWATTGTVTPVAFQLMSGQIGVQAYINKTSALDMSKPITLDGLTSIELVYL